MWLLFCSNLKEDQEWQIHARQGRDSEGRRVWLSSSADLGKSWSSPREITAQVKRPGWTWYATGPGAGVQLESGRLLLPCNHAEDVEEHEHPYLVSWGRSRMVAHCVYSDLTLTLTLRLTLTLTLRLILTLTLTQTLTLPRWPTASTPTTTGAAGTWAGWRPSIPTRPRSPSVPTARCPPELEPEP